jgi:hypothetical protein
MGRITAPKKLGRKKGVSYEVSPEYRRKLEKLGKETEEKLSIVKHGLEDFITTGNKSGGTRLRQDIRKLRYTAKSLLDECLDAANNMREIHS